MQEIGQSAFDEMQASDATPATLQETMSCKGYVLLREVLPRDLVRSALSDVAQVLASAGWLLPEADPMERKVEPTAACGDPDPAFKRIYQQVFNLESFHALPHHPALRAVMVKLLGDRLLIHPKPIGRLIFPRCERLVTHAHQDYEFMGGDPECYTAWIPLHDCPLEMGPLRILEGSHRFGIRPHQREGLHVPEIALDSIAGERWVAGAVNAGDVLLFHSLTVHAASANLSDGMRVSLDCRFQDARRGLNPANLVFAGESGKSWDKTYTGWRSGALKYYWRNMPLNLSPSLDELAARAETADSPSLRAKYARMVAQLSKEPH